MGTDAPDGSIVISPKEFYDGVRQDIADIKAGLAPLSPMRKDVDELHHRLGLAETRIGQLEARVWRASGFAAAIGLAASWIIPSLLK